MVKIRSRRFKILQSQISVEKMCEPIEAINLLKSGPKAKFSETFEVHCCLDLNTKYSDQQLRASVVLPKGTGKRTKIAVITNEAEVNKIKNFGVDIVGSKDLVESIANGFLEFDQLLTTPDMMPVIAKVGKILGPRGLMPSPKSGSVTSDIYNAIQEFKKGKLEYRTDKSGIVHSIIGKIDFTAEDLLNNLIAIKKSIDQNRPNGAKGKYWKNMYLCTTMSPAIKIDFNKLQELEKNYGQN
uniref:Large ribosomal subunit protein uL1c n=1 Tax=Cyanidium caldarium TaxID=2771 RepID=RK1_CYACA|nr:ribosomal protein L1 [Cyanidium caldarium]Q9TM00.1 RecName: Full=Large ribosomal subunit protein uL1c; AltName: Full=50S ribosomal protein L1, chloroplastic [Cyanidium caldarium]AAF12977.1 unknown [Cyanidium caldarium]WDB00242.1 ribosomal protein L1 [Cyanidium caldarium]